MHKPAIYSSISCNLDEQILSAALPLFAAEKVEAIEWSFDTLFKVRDIPDWFVELLTVYGNGNRLTGHGVYFSLFSGGWSDAQAAWLNHLAKVSRNFRFDHISEHFGFMTGKNFHHGAPLPIPFTDRTLAIGHDRLKRIYQACGCPVGLENLAFSYSIEEVKKHGDFLEKLVEPVNGFIILDVHNLYCQCHNFDVTAQALLALYPLHRVREMHISGGSWEDSPLAPGEKIRRDTHDDGVPAEVFELLAICIPKCPQLKFVVLEQLSNALGNEAARTRFREDFDKMQAIVKAAGCSNPPTSVNHFLPVASSVVSDPLQDPQLLAEQGTLSDILESAVDFEHARDLLRSSQLANSAWEIEKWEPQMLETARAIAQKWKHGFTGSP